LHCPSAGCACCCGAMQVYRECSRSALSFPRLQDRCIDPDIIFGYRIGVCSRARDRWSASMDSTFIQPWIHLPVETIGCSSPTGDQSDGEPAPGACPHAGHADVSAPAQRPNNLAMRLRITDQKKPSALRRLHTVNVQLVADDLKKPRQEMASAKSFSLDGMQSIHPRTTHRSQPNSG